MFMVDDPELRMDLPVDIEVRVIADVLKEQRDRSKAPIMSEHTQLSETKQDSTMTIPLAFGTTEIILFVAVVGAVLLHKFVGPPRRPFWPPWRRK
jgi:hypothetical protein